MGSVMAKTKRATTVDKVTAPGVSRSDQTMCGPSVPSVTGTIKFERNKYWKRWTGTREQLIERGICTAKQFPKGRKRLKWSHSWNMRRKAGGLYDFAVDVSDAERQADAQLHEELKLVPFRLGTLPKSHEQFRERLVHDLKGTLDAFRVRLESGCWGYRAAPEVIEGFAEFAGDVLDMLSEARTIFNHRAARQAMTEILMPSAKANFGLQRFLEGLEGMGAGGREFESRRPDQP